MTFSKALAQSEIPTASYRIWTWVADLISYDNNSCISNNIILNFYKMKYYRPFLISNLFLLLLLFFLITQIVSLQQGHTK